MSSLPSPVFAPYGLMPIHLYKLPRQLKKPKFWNDLVDYAEWIEAVARLLGDTLWPLWEPTSGWRGAAAGGMEALTRADFALLPPLRAMLDAPFRPGASDTNKQLFAIEDVDDVKRKDNTVIFDRNLDQTLAIYIGGTLDPQHERLKEGYLLGIGAHAGDIDLDLKFRIQRPRAYHTALFLGIDTFDYEDATSAVTPSMISGHCFQTSMGGIAAWLAAKKANLPQPTLDAIARHTCDVGDRRVMAGVHYPSDNISSWITALLAHPFVFGDDTSREWYCDTISKRSAVHKAIQGAVAADPRSAFAAPFALLESLYGATAKTVSQRLHLNLVTEPSR